MSLFTPLTGFLGGSLIGGSAALLLVTNGDILGFSGMCSSVGLHPLETTAKPSNHWKLAFVGSFMLAVNVYVNLIDKACVDDNRLQSPQVAMTSTLGHMLAGFFVGLGTKLSNGCTSGHGVCGLARFSKRSWIAVPTFMAFGVATASFITDPSTSWSSYTSFLRTTDQMEHSYVPWMGSLATAAIVGLALMRTKPSKDDLDEKKLPAAAVSGVMAATGLCLSGMTKSSKVEEFLDLSFLFGAKPSGMDPTLMVVMGSAVMVSFIGYQFIPGWSVTKKENLLEKPLSGCSASFNHIPTNTTVDGQLIGGAALFGIGWGLAGICPGPALFQAAAGMVDILVAWFPAFYVGGWMGEQIKKQLAAKKKSS